MRHFGRSEGTMYKAERLVRQGQQRKLQFKYTWFFAAWCELRRAFRNFRVDRMEAVLVTDKPFLTEPGKTLEEYISAIEKEIG